MKLKPGNSTNQRLLASIFFLVTAFVITNVQASECETLQFQRSKSQGVSIKNNVCETDDRVSVGSVFTLIPGSRLWLKAQADSSTDFQLICQSRAKRIVEVNISSKFLPWISPIGFSRCGAWVNNKLSCQDDRGSKNDFICAIAVIKRPEFLKVTSLERTTSVKMRTINSDKKKPKSEVLAEPELINSVVDFIRSEVGLCRDVYQVKRKIKVSWALDVMGQIEILSFAKGEHLDQQFRSCVTSVITKFAYPKFNEPVAFAQEL
jgi:hypothetical protein